MKKFFRWLKLMIEWMGSSHDDAHNEVAMILQLRKENLDLADENRRLKERIEVLQADIFDAWQPDHTDYDRLVLQFSSFFLNCNLQQYLHPEEIMFIRRIWFQAIACAFQLGQVQNDRTTKH